MVQIIWSEKSKNDLKDIYDFIAKNSKYYAAKTVTTLKNRTTILKTYKEIGKIVPEFEMETIRELIEGNYRIVYQIADSNRVEIVSVFHASRDMKNAKLMDNE